jgi:hypothetical protein
VAGAVLAPGLLVTGCFSSPPQIVSLSPSAGSTQQPANAPIQVVFDQPVIHRSVAAAFGICALEGGGCLPGLPGCPDIGAAFGAPSGAPCWVTWLPNQPGFVLQHPGALFAPNTKYQLSLGAGVSSVDGTVNSLDHAWTLTSAAAPVLTAVAPANGATGVARGDSLSLSFSRAMSLPSLERAVSLSPAVSGVQVLADSLDTGSFEVIPAAPLDPDTTYTLTVSQGATDTFGQPLGQAVRTRFTTAAFAPGAQVLILAGPAGGPATQLLIGQLSAPAAGEPLPDEVLAGVPDCAESAGCGAVPSGQPTAAIEAAALAPGAGWLALVERDLTTPGAQPVLQVIDLTTGAPDLQLAGATWPAWSPDGSTLAFVAAGSRVELYHPATAGLSQLQPGPPLAGPPVWTGAGDTLAIPVTASAGVAGHVDLANPGVGARYTLPGLTGDVQTVVAAPTGEEIAIEVTAAGGTTTWVDDPSSAQPPTRVGSGLAPVGFVDNATLIAVQTSPPGRAQLVRINLASGGSSALARGPGTPDLSSASLAAGGRQIAYLDETAAGSPQVLVANADGTGARAMAPPMGGLVPLSAVISG